MRDHMNIGYDGVKGGLLCIQKRIKIIPDCEYLVDLLRIIPTIPPPHTATAQPTIITN